MNRTTHTHPTQSGHCKDHHIRVQTGRCCKEEKEMDGEHLYTKSHHSSENNNEMCGCKQETSPEIQSCCASEEPSSEGCCQNPDTPRAQGCCQQVDQDETHLSSMHDTTHLQKLLLETNERYLRLYADFDNYKKRTNKEFGEIGQRAKEQLLLDIVAVIDDFERGMAQLKGEVKQTSNYEDGFHLIYNKLLQVLKKSSVAVMETQIGDDADPDLHEIISQIPVKEEAQKGKIAFIIEKGYMTGDKMLRCAKVSVGI